MMATRLKTLPQKKIPAFDYAWDHLIHGQNAGHMGAFEYDGADMNLWADFLNKNKDAYYTPIKEPIVIKKSASISSAYIGYGPITLVSRGPGTKFAAKEGLLSRYLRYVTKIIYIDENEDALKQSMAQGKEIFPDASHETIHHDMFDPNLRYDVVGTEVNVLFGLTLGNVSGFVSDGAPEKDYTDKMNTIQAQMTSGAHFIFTGDTNQNKESIENSYAGQDEFALDMLRRHGMDIPVSFQVMYHPQSYILSHNFVFDRPAKITTLRGNTFFEKGDVLHFNSSGKFPADVQIKWTEKTGLKSLFTPERTIKDDEGCIAWFHFVKP